MFIHGHPCQIFGISAEYHLETVMRLEKKYSKQKFDDLSDGTLVIFVFYFMKTDGKYRIAISVRPVFMLPPLIALPNIGHIVKKIKLEH